MEELEAFLLQKVVFLFLALVGAKDPVELRLLLLEVGSFLSVALQDGDIRGGLINELLKS